MNVEFIGKRIREIRKMQNLTIEQLAEKAEITPNYMGQIERGARTPSTDSLIRLSKELDVSIDYLCGSTEMEHNYYVNQIISKMAGLSENQQKAILQVFEGIETFVQG